MEADGRLAEASLVDKGSNGIEEVCRLSVVGPTGWLTVWVVFVDTPLIVSTALAGPVHLRRKKPIKECHNALAVALVWRSRHLFLHLTWQIDVVEPGQSV